MIDLETLKLEIISDTETLILSINFRVSTASISAVHCLTQSTFCTHLGCCVHLPCGQKTNQIVQCLIIII